MSPHPYNFVIITTIFLLPLMGCQNDYNKISNRNNLNLATADCGDLWNELWPQAKAGNLSARDVLGELVYTRSLRIPGQPIDGWVDTYLTLVVHEYMTLNKNYKLLGSDIVRQPAGGNLAHCFSVRWSLFGNAARRSCVDQALEQGLIIKFENFVQYVEQHQQEGERVTCTK